MMSAVRIVVLGDRNVGKSAVTVRFLTHRFIGEYNSDADLLCKASIKQEDHLVDLEVLDTCMRSSLCVIDEARAAWADAIVVVFSVLSRKSFMSARDLVQAVRGFRSSTFTPVLLLANMTDLDHRRQVQTVEGQQAALDLGCQFFEVSAAEDVTGVSVAFWTFLKDAKLAQQQNRNSSLKRRRSSLALATVSRRLGAMFGKRDSGNGNAGANSCNNGGTSVLHNSSDGNGSRKSSVESRDVSKT